MNNSMVPANESHLRRMQAQVGLLNLLQPGAMLRFVYRCENGRLRFGIEGADAEGGTGTLEELLRLAMETLRREGLVFDHASEASEGAGVGKQGRWIPIEPSARPIGVKAAAKLGFQTEASKPEMDAFSLLAPAFPSSHPRRWLDFVAAPLLKDNPLLAIEIEFKARRLTEKQTKEMLALLEQRVIEHKLLLGENVPLGAVERFLGLWVRSGNGWRIRCRVQIGKNEPEPKALLGLIAGEVFESPLQSEPLTEGVPNASDFHDVYPEGWELPSLLPPADYFEDFSARRILNGRVPRLPETGILLGTVEGAELRIPQEMRDRHSYIVGATGTGKSTLLFNMIQQDLKNV